jgi:hypothetical protein
MAKPGGEVLQTTYANEQFVIEKRNYVALMEGSTCSIGVN